MQSDDDADGIVYAKGFLLMEQFSSKNNSIFRRLINELSGFIQIKINQS